jgi:hypothetical protein
MSIRKRRDKISKREVRKEINDERKKVKKKEYYKVLNY